MRKLAQLVTTATRQIVYSDRDSSPIESAVTTADELADRIERAGHRARDLGNLKLADRCAMLVASIEKMREELNDAVLAGEEIAAKEEEARKVAANRQLHADAIALGAQMAADRIANAERAE